MTKRIAGVACSALMWAWKSFLLGGVAGILLGWLVIEGVVLGTGWALRFE